MPTDNNTIKSARLRAGLTQSEVAARLGVSQVSYSKIENGNPTVGKIQEICQKMGWNLIFKIRI